MPTIHHTQNRKAEKLGFKLIATDSHVIAEKGALHIYGASAADAIVQMEAALEIQQIDERFRFQTVVDEDYRFVRAVIDGHTLLVASSTPHALLDLAKKWANGERELVELPVPNNGDTAEEILQMHNPGVDEPGYREPLTVHSEGTDEPTTDPAPAAAVVLRNPVGIALDGAVAYAEGTVTADCPYEEGTDEAEEWFVAWDEAADAATEQAEEDKVSGSVVNSKFRARYAEAGHPTHCGDWLAEKINGIVQNKEGTNLELFEEICGMNGVDLSKYNRETKGWRGRLRMTGRNLLAKVVFKNDGILKLPETLGGEVKAPQEWMTQQRFKSVKA